MGKLITAQSTQIPVVGDRVELLAKQIATGAGRTVTLPSGKKTLQGVAVGSSGAFAATILVQVSNNGQDWLTAGTITLSGTSPTNATDGFTLDAPWAFIRGNLSVISGTGAAASLIMGV